MSHASMLSIAAAAALTAPAFGDAFTTFVHATAGPDEATYVVGFSFADPGVRIIGVVADPDHEPIRFLAEAPLIQHETLAGAAFGDVNHPVFSLPGDSWVAVGDDFGVANTTFTPGFLGWDGAPTTSLIHGAFFEQLDGGGWMDADPDTPVTGPDIIVAQFTLPAGADFQFVGTLVWENGLGIEFRDGFHAGVLELEGACCLPTGECRMEIDFVCEGYGGTWNGAATPCRAVTCTPTCYADLDDGGDVGFPDLLLLLADWGCAGFCAGDLNADQTTDFADLLLLLSAWGPCRP